MVGTSKLPVAKLTDNHYQAYKFKMKMLLVREGTWTYRQEAKPEQPSNAWIAGDQHAQSGISLNVDDNQVVHTCNYGTTKKM